ncbi:phospholipase [Pseudomonas sp.]|jgi:1-phosphatidylinositol phosphodiesterase|uniref:phospholipase n=1 Tax=Pseudomonas sp. TaxID=306 RepID=UPI002E336D48|nr:phospholipase [Pseudomonas sp.]HEX4550318.1 phospholipase [Pseudomonas sp.]
MNNDFSKYNWMAATPAIDVLSLTELSLPGTHNAGSDWKADYALLPGRHLLACQHDSFFAQLNHGARALDLRLACLSKVKGIMKYRCRHNTFLSSRTLLDLVYDVKTFLHLNPDEFVILDFHELADSEGAFDFKEFNQHMIEQLGPRMIPARNARLSLTELKRINPMQRILACAPWHIDLDSNLFGRKIEHKWEEKSSTKASNLKNYISDVMTNPPGTWEPWSLSAATYTIPIGPVDLHEELDDWFDPDRSDWAVKSSIINVDFIEESKIVDFCRTANLIKANRKQPR